MWYSSSSFMKTHLSSIHQIIKAISMKYKAEDLTSNIIKDLNNLIIIEENSENTFNSYHISK